VVEREKTDKARRRLDEQYEGLARVQRDLGLVANGAMGLTEPSSSESLDQSPDDDGSRGRD
jgi:hypothetical protein